jgi:hypothetical protein
MRVLRAILHRCRVEGVPPEAMCEAMVSETTSLLHEVFGPQRAAEMLRAFAGLVEVEPAEGATLN